MHVNGATWYMPIYMHDLPPCRWCSGGCERRWWGRLGSRVLGGRGLVASFFLGRPAHPLYIGGQDLAGRPLAQIEYGVRVLPELLPPNRPKGKVEFEVNSTPSPQTDPKDSLSLVRLARVGPHASPGPWLSTSGVCPSGVFQTFHK
jgi:hypothetical protein